jgi:hypothetical protein
LTPVSTEMTIVALTKRTGLPVDSNVTFLGKNPPRLILATPEDLN